VLFYLLYDFETSNACVIKFEMAAKYIRQLLTIGGLGVTTIGLCQWNISQRSHQAPFRYSDEKRHTPIRENGTKMQLSFDSGRIHSRTHDEISDKKKNNRGQKEREGGGAGTIVGGEGRAGGGTIVGGEGGEAGMIVGGEGGEAGTIVGGEGGGGGTIVGGEGGGGADTIVGGEGGSWIIITRN
jgi:hypothetical protein